MAERFRSYMGPGDKDLPRANEVQGYQPVSRIGEVVMNAFVDAYEHQVLPKQNVAGDLPPAFHEWATIQPGMIVLARKKRTAQYRQFHAAETAMPVIGCAECLGPNDEPNFFFAGVCRSKTIRGPDDGIGPSVDEFFTLSLGGMVTLLNTSSASIFAGDLCEWTLSFANAAKSNAKRARHGPRRVGIQTATVSSPKIIGRALSFAKPGEPLDMLLKQ